MNAKAVDVNKDTIMKMLRTDVWGFKPVDIEAKAKDIYHLVSGQEGFEDAKMLNGYLRNQGGYVIIVPKSSSQSKKSKKK